MCCCLSSDRRFSTSRRTVLTKQSSCFDRFDHVMNLLMDYMNILWHELYISLKEFGHSYSIHAKTSEDHCQLINRIFVAVEAFW